MKCCVMWLVFGVLLVVVNDVSRFSLNRVVSCFMVGCFVVWWFLVVVVRNS